MNNLISKYFDKFKIDSVKMSDEEKVTFDRWEHTLSDEPLTIEKLTEWLEFRKTAVGATLGNLDNSTEKVERLVIWQTLLDQVIKLINSPKAERENLESHIQNLLDGNKNNKL